MFLNIYQNYTVVFFLILYFFNITILLVWFFFFYHDNLNNFNLIYINSNYFKTKLFLLVSFLVGLPPFTSFFIKFFLFIYFYPFTKSLIFVVFLIITINIYVLWYGFLFFTFNYSCNKKLITNSVFTEYKYISYTVWLIFFQLF